MIRNENYTATNGSSTTTKTNTNSSTNKCKPIPIGNYLLRSTIGKGNSAVVKLATHALTKQKVAIKMFDRSGLDADKTLRLKREIDTMKRLRHPNIIQLYEVFRYYLC
jgi:serine/threonine-protein kinase SIK3